MNQRERVLKAIQNAPQGICTHEFFKMNPPILRPASRVDELRKMGYMIGTKRVGKGNFKYIMDHQVTPEEVWQSIQIGEGLDEDHIISRTFWD